MKHTKKTLGRGLDSLLDAEVIGSSSISEVAISDIYPNPDQPRRTFEEESLKELAASLRSIGLVQPITLLKKSTGDYMIISGERRWRAARMAGMTTLPAYIKTEEDEHVMEMALIENIQREDLNAIEISLAYQKLIETYDLTQEELSTRVGKKRTTISNYLRLLKLPGEIQIGLTQKKIDMGHARALLSIPDPEHQLALYAEIIRQGLSVRAVESLAARYREEGADSSAKQKKAKQSLPEEYRLLTGQLSRFFRTKVKLDCDAKGKGKLTIPFASEEELERIMALLERIR
ncbi:chromosome partitioning protein ParB [Porphyromonas gulae]|uniref:ParB/RepB/Spo0J family partition protein n=1 Tax=Porphyromonas TaxID=836 RepID=UPI00051DAC4A|nr:MULTISPECIES: ParB/RepB/Spo0J family partition protein [Porphyromonas]KGL55479.1 chromosome partitioning protein ParB [Porphyromonas sp. COT-052 OH4946]KGN67638.1 chromosome partitioning protein ParB [Porphyromonas gulae]KGN72699.1 chromosome partitioning protein ParB [Porphyromonas gulae]KGN75590.1 chromosome partitioning protein ParB [Porphyromonas gulae]KGO04071.1 chromosome partitioning protein ParB [Porphyromonas gulae]